MVEHALGDGRAQLRHAPGEPGRHAAAVKGQIGASGALHDKNNHAQRRARPCVDLYIRKPPFTSSTWPVIYAASSLARKQTACATSISVPMRPRGISGRRRSRAAGSSAAVMAVSIKPGATALTVIPREATSWATALVRPIKPALAAT